jgi:hypothetical protein
MKYNLSLWLFCAPLSIAKGIFQRQSGTSATSVSVMSTSSVFSIPTPSTAPSVNGSEHDLSKHFCRLWRHQSQLQHVKFGFFIDSYFQVSTLMGKSTLMVEIQLNTALTGREISLTSSSIFQMAIQHSLPSLWETSNRE